MPVNFSRKVAFRGIGDNTTSDVEQYVASQVNREALVDSRYAEMLQQFTINNPTVALDKPRETNSGRYWYNLQLFL